MAVPRAPSIRRVFSLSPAGRAKLAELVALVRDGPDLCNDNTTLGMDVIALYIGWGNQAPSENEIEAKQRELAAMKARVGVAKWCMYYRTQLKAARVIQDFNSGNQD